MSNSSQMIPYTTLWSPKGYMEDVINHDDRGVRGTEMCLLGSNKEHRGEGRSYGQGAPPRKGHQVPVKATEGEISPLLFLLLVFLLHAIFLNHIRKNLFYVFKFIFIGVQFV